MRRVWGGSSPILPGGDSSRAERPGPRETASLCCPVCPAPSPSRRRWSRSFWSGKIERAMASLLDVNALIALVDADHVGHDLVHRWFAQHANKGWATCPVTENGMIRILSQPAYPSGRRSPAEVIEVLRSLKMAFSKSHRFWPDEISLTDESLFLPQFITGSKIVTDAYLLGLAARRKATLVSLDRSLPWQAVRGGTAGLVETPS